MRTWDLGIEDQYSLVLACDSRLSSPDYTNDQIWEVIPGGGEPPSLSLETTFGLRARLMRLFPQFIVKENGQTFIHSDPRKFYQPLCINSFSAGWVSLSCSPFMGLSVDLDYWMPSSQVIAGRLTFSNPSVLNISFRFEWIGILSPLGEGESMSPLEMGATQVLQGKTIGLSPVCYLTGGPEASAGPLPGLALDIDLAPGGSRQLSWALACLPDQTASFELARQTTARNFDAERARLELHDEADRLEIQTGNPGWDAALAFSQKTAYQLFFPASPTLPNPSFVLARIPDHGYSMRNDGSDYSYLWNGQTPLDAYYLSQLILPGGSRLAAGLVENFLAVQEETGFIDWKPGLAGQRSRHLAQPILAALAAVVSEYQEAGWLEKIYPSLSRFMACWFHPDHDRDQDGFPEWDHPLQTGLEDAPLYDRWSPVAQGVNIPCLEAPSLGAFAYNECRHLARMARQLGLSSDVDRWNLRAEKVKSAVDSAWDARTAGYRYRDAVSHDTSSGQSVAQFRKPGSQSLKKNFRSPQRLRVQITGKAQATRPVKVRITGTGSIGKITEEILPFHFFWANGKGFSTTHNLFTRVTKIDVEGLGQGDRCGISTVDFLQSDISTLLPLWAGIPGPHQAKAIVERGLDKKYLQAYGLSIVPGKAQKTDTSPAGQISIVWNSLIGEGMLAYGFRRQAADLVSRLLNVIAANLQQNHAFGSSYQALTGQIIGERNSLRGLAPVGLFLKTAGIQKISSREVILEGTNAFPFPITVKYQGVTVICRSLEKIVRFSPEHSVTVEGAGPHRITLE